MRPFHTLILPARLKTFSSGLIINADPLFPRTRLNDSLWQL
jgi:hypothetical protein